MSVEETKHRDVSENGFPKPPEGHYWNVIPGVTSGGDMNLIVELMEKGRGWDKVVESKATPLLMPDDPEAGKTAAVEAMHSILSVINSPVWGLGGRFW